jgi:hypothetical protein
MNRCRLKIKIFIIIGIILISMGLVSRCNNAMLLEINWELRVPNPKSIEVIYNFEYREGNDFEIWTYDSSDIEDMKEYDKFKIITEGNIDLVKGFFKKYYDDLSYDEEKISKFKENFSIENEIKEDNYYLLIKDDEGTIDEDFLLLYLDVENNKVYYFASVR